MVYFLSGANLLLASMSLSRGAVSDDESCSLTFAMSLGCKKSNQLWPIRSFCQMEKAIQRVTSQSDDSYTLSGESEQHSKALPDCNLTFCRQTLTQKGSFPDHSPQRTENRQQPETQSESAVSRSQGLSLSTAQKDFSLAHLPLKLSASAHRLIKRLACSQLQYKGLQHLKKRV